MSGLTFTGKAYIHYFQISYFCAYFYHMLNTIDVKGIQSHYKKTGSGPVVLLLHGWGGSLEIFQKLHSALETNFTVYAPDLPGFGKSETPDTVWGVTAYTDWLRAFITAEKITNPILLGHSFGGRISILYASKYPVSKLILANSAGIKPKRKPAYYVKVYSYKAVKHILPLLLGKKQSENILEQYRKKVGSSDYKNANPTMRNIMVKVINEDLKKYLKDIQAPTLLMWGENDTATPVNDAKIMEKNIPDAGLVVLKNAGHYSFIDKEYEFITIVKNFLGITQA